MSMEDRNSGITSRKKFPLVFAGLLVLAVIISIATVYVLGEPREDAAENIKLYCEAIVKGDEVAMAQLNEGNDSKLSGMDMVSSFQNALQSAGYTKLSDTESRRIGEAFIQSLKSITVDTKLKDSSGLKATVEVTITRFDMQAAKQKASSLLRERMRLGATPEEIRATAIETTVETYRNLESAGTVTFFVPCTYNEKAKRWEPADPIQFGYDLSKQMLGMT